MTALVKVLSLGLIVSAPVFALGCSGGNSSTQQSTGDAVTNIPQSSVKDQGQTGNCWLYATGAWIESVEAEVPGGPGTSFSPAYWDYWDWHDQILAGATNVQFGGNWGRAVDIVKRYGMVPMGTFVHDDATDAVTALAALNTSLASGALSTAASRQDPTQALTALNAAFGISASQAEALAATFGADGTKTFDLGAHVSTKFPTVTRAQDILVETPVPGGLVVAVKLEDLIGTSANDGQPDDRVGQYAWSAAYPPSAMSSTVGTPGVYGKLPDAASLGAGGGNAGSSDSSGTTAAWRAYEIRLQTALNAFASLPLAWGVAFPDMDYSTGNFHRVATQVQDDESSFGWHESLVTDYQITNVPGFGTLAAGTPATAAQKTAALDPNAQVSFFRVKNSWGAFAQGALLSGYDDLDTQYLEQPLGLLWQGSLDETLPSLVIDVVVPAGF